MPHARFCEVARKRARYRQEQTEEQKDRTGNRSRRARKLVIWCFAQLARVEDALRCCVKIIGVVLVDFIGWLQVTSH